MISLGEIKKLCQEYDRVNGEHPESYLEGFSVYQFIVEQMRLTYLAREYEHSEEGRGRWMDEACAGKNA